MKIISITDSVEEIKAYPTFPKKIINESLLYKANTIVKIVVVNNKYSQILKY